MIRFSLFFLFFALLTNCTNFKDSGFSSIKSVNEENKSEISINHNKSNEELFNMTFNEFNIFLNNYANKSKYPKF